MVRIDTRYVIPAPRAVVWEYLTDPARESEYGWALNGGQNEILERRANGVRFRGGRDRASVGRKSFLSTFDGVFHPERWAIDWRILEGFEAGSAFTEELVDHPEGTQVHVFGTIRLNNVDWDQRLQALVFPGRARATIERNLCRDYKRLKDHLVARQSSVQEVRA